MNSNHPEPDLAVNDQTGEASPGVIRSVEEHPSGDIPASPTPEPPETAEETQAARRPPPGAKPAQPRSDPAAISPPSNVFAYRSRESPAK